MVGQRATNDPSTRRTYPRTIWPRTSWPSIASWLQNAERRLGGHRRPQKPMLPDLHRWTWSTCTISWQKSSLATSSVCAKSRTSRTRASKNPGLARSRSGFYHVWPKSRCEGIALPPVWAAKLQESRRLFSMLIAAWMTAFACGLVRDASPRRFRRPTACETTPGAVTSCRRPDSCAAAVLESQRITSPLWPGATTGEASTKFSCTWGWFDVNSRSIVRYGLMRACPGFRVL
jgi:hypothetical protein